MALVGLTAGLAVVGASPANAGLTAGVFELDGNAVDDGATGQDWANVYAATTASPPGCPTGTTACSFATEPTLTSTIFTGGGSKDPNDIPQWRWKDESGGLPDKDNLLHSFAARYNDSGSDLLYFGSDRYDNSGDAHQAFWFFQNKVETVAGGTFSGTHRNGDLLVISEFSNGGSVSTITIYKWMDGALQFVTGGENVKCDPAVAQAFCGIVNPADGTASPWPYLDKKNRDAFGQGEFFEGGINLSDPTIGLGGRCFASFASETRSSTSTTSVLKDFVLSSFSNCGSTTVTTPMQGATGAAIPAEGLSIGTAAAVQVRDRAVVTVTGGGGSLDGDSVAFRLCGPIAVPTVGPVVDPLCTATAENRIDLGSVTIPNGSGTTATVDSPVATVTSAGRYCFGATYLGNAAKGISGSEDSRSSECFTITPVRPTIATTAGPVPAGATAASVLLGEAVTDTANLSGTALQPRSPITFLSSTSPAPAAGAPAGGTLTFRLYGPDSCSTLAHTSAAVPVSGDGAYSPASFTPTRPGRYHWRVEYSGNGPNTLGNTHNDLCSVSAESVTVRQLTPTIATAQSFVPNDSATIAVAGGGGPTGDVTFSLFDNATCAGTALWSQTVALPAGDALSKTVSTTSTRAYTTDTAFSWLVSYTSTNASHTGASHACGIETSSLTIDNDTRTP